MTHQQKGGSNNPPPPLDPLLDYNNNLTVVSAMIVGDNCCIVAWAHKQKGKPLDDQTQGKTYCISKGVYSTI